MATHTPSALTRSVRLSFPAAVQVIAALDARIGWARLAGEDWAAADAHAALVAVREAFDLWPCPVSEAALDAAHEAALAAMDELREADVPLAAFDPAEGSPDPIPDALASYWNRGA